MTGSMTGSMTGGAGFGCSPQPQSRAPRERCSLSLICCPLVPAHAWPSVGRPNIACAYDGAGGPTEARDRTLSALSPEPGTPGAVAAVAVDSGASD